MLDGPSVDRFWFVRKTGKVPALKINFGGYRVYQALDANDFGRIVHIAL